MFFLYLLGKSEIGFLCTGLTMASFFVFVIFDDFGSDLVCCCFCFCFAI